MNKPRRRNFRPRVVKLKPVTVEERAELVAILEEELRLAKAGETVAFAMATVDNQNRTFSVHHIPRKLSMVLGSIELLKYDILSEHGNGAFPDED